MYIYNLLYENYTYMYITNYRYIKINSYITDYTKINTIFVHVLYTYV